jgi:hypothetical protein
MVKCIKIHRFWGVKFGENGLEWAFVRTGYRTIRSGILWLMWEWNR